MKTWLTEVVLEAYRAEGVTWSEQELQERAEAVAREIRRMNMHDHYAKRKRRKHEVLFGLMNGDDDTVALEAYQERQRLKTGDWGDGPRGNGRKNDSHGKE